MKQTEHIVFDCSHDRTEPVLNYADQPIAYRCSECTQIMSHVGECSHCKTNGKLRFFKTKARFCDDECHKRYVAARRKKSEQGAV